MGLDQLIARLEQDAQARIDARLAEARAEVGQIEAEVGRANARMREEELARRREERRGRLEQKRAEAIDVARARLLRARHALLERVFQRAQGQLEGLEFEPALGAAIRRWVTLALAHLPPDARLRCRPSFARALAGPGLKVEPDASMPVGAVIEAAGEALSVDLTAARRLERARPRLAIALLKELPR